MIHADINTHIQHSVILVCYTSNQFENTILKKKGKPLSARVTKTVNYLGINSARITEWRKL